MTLSDSTIFLGKIRHSQTKQIKNKHPLGTEFLTALFSVVLPTLQQGASTEQKNHAEVTVESRPVERASRLRVCNDTHALSRSLPPLTATPTPTPSTRLPKDCMT